MHKRSEKGKGGEGDGQHYDVINSKTIPKNV